MTGWWLAATLAGTLIAGFVIGASLVSHLTKHHIQAIDERAEQIHDRIAAIEEWTT